MLQGRAPIDSGVLLGDTFLSSLGIVESLYFRPSDKIYVGLSVRNRVFENSRLGKRCGCGGVGIPALLGFLVVFNCVLEFHDDFRYGI